MCDKVPSPYVEASVETDGHDTETASCKQLAAVLHPGTQRRASQLPVPTFQAADVGCQSHAQQRGHALAGGARQQVCQWPVSSWCVPCAATCKT